MKRRFAVAGTLVVLLLAAGCLGGQTLGGEEERTLPTYNTSQQNPRQVTVNVRQFQFEPDTIEARQGEWIQIELVSEDTNHGLHIPAYNVTVEASFDFPQTSDAFRVTENGTFTFEQTRSGRGFNQMEGELVVTPAPE